MVRTKCRNRVLFLYFITSRWYGHILFSYTLSLLFFNPWRRGGWTNKIHSVWRKNSVLFGPEKCRLLCVAKWRSVTGEWSTCHIFDTATLTSSPTETCIRQCFYWFVWVGGGWAIFRPLQRPFMENLKLRVMEKISQRIRHQFKIGLEELIPFSGHFLGLHSVTSVWITRTSEILRSKCDWKNCKMLLITCANSQQLIGSKTKTFASTHTCRVAVF